MHGYWNIRQLLFPENIVANEKQKKQSKNWLLYQILKLHQNGDSQNVWEVSAIITNCDICIRFVKLCSAAKLSKEMTAKASKHTEHGIDNDWDIEWRSMHLFFMRSKMYLSK